MPQKRRFYSKSFKAQVIDEFAQPETSIANVALTHNLNANLVHKWIRVYAQMNRQGEKIPCNRSKVNSALFSRSLSFSQESF